MTDGQVLDIAVKAGEILIRSGSEIYRAEDTITRICSSYGLKCECFVLVSGIFAEVEGKNGEHHYVIRRIKSYSTDLKRIHLVNTFSRNIEKKTLDYQKALETLNTIESVKSYSFLKRVSAAMLTSFVYALLLGGNIIESISAFFSGLVVYSLGEILQRIGFPKFFELFIQGASAGFMGFIASILFPGQDSYRIIIGTIIFLVPGVAITNGIKDALYGDTLSSLYRMAEAVFTAIAVGAGVGIALSASIHLK
ncbi:MAG TPA: threonine/serine exporter family protein [Clostridia bacterium]